MPMQQQLKHVLYYALVFIPFLIIPNVASAYTDFSKTSAFTMGYTKTMKEVVAGEKRLDEIGYLCMKVVPNFLKTELKKIEYNDIFQEIGTEEQITDILELQKSLRNTKDCIKHFKLWLAYDDKWYAENRNKKWQITLQKQEEWASEVVDTGDDVWNGVMNGTFLSIPRKFIWFGSREPDGYSHTMNLQFFYPNMEAMPLPDSDQKNKRTNIAGLLKVAYVRTRPCIGFEDRKSCSQHTFQIPFFVEYLDCTAIKVNETRGGRPYYGPWRRACGFSDGSNYHQEPVFDEEVGLWRIGNSGYYEGTPEFPDYWFSCEKPKDLEDANTLGNRQCEAALAVNDRLYFDYIFPRHLFWQHREIHDRLKERIQNFITKTSTERYEQ